MTEPEAEYNKPNNNKSVEKYWGEIKQTSSCKCNRTISFSALEGAFILFTAIYATLNKDVVFTNAPAIATAFGLALIIKRATR